MKSFKQFIKDANVYIKEGVYVGFSNGDYGQVLSIDEDNKKFVYESVEQQIPVTSNFDLKEDEFDKFFKKALKKFGASSPDQLNDKKKKKFFDYVDKNWKAVNEQQLNENGFEKYMFDSKEKAEKSGKDLGISGTHKHNDMYMPGNSHEEFVKFMKKDKDDE